MGFSSANADLPQMRKMRVMTGMIRLNVNETVVHSQRCYGSRRYLRFGGQKANGIFGVVWFVIVIRFSEGVRRNWLQVKQM